MTDSERRAIVRKWFNEILMRNPGSLDELNMHVWVFATKGPEACITGIIDSREGRNVLNQKRKSVGLSPLP